MNASIEKYLKAYNIVQFSAWFIALLFLNFDSEISLSTILIFQFISLVEIFHAYKKWTNTSVFLTFAQIVARLFILTLVYVIIFEFLFSDLGYFDDVIKIMFYAWCIAETIRYAYYVTQLFKKENKIITWLRYSVFIACYPIGLACEFLLMHFVFVKNDNILVRILLILVAIVYIFLFPRLYLHLLKQRKIKLIKNNS